MSTKYKFHDQEELYFLSYSVVFWIDLFIRNEYKNIIPNSWEYCKEHKGMIYMHTVYLPAGRQDDKSYPHDYRNTSR